MRLYGQFYIINKFKHNLNSLLSNAVDYLIYNKLNFRIQTVFQHFYLKPCKSEIKYKSYKLDIII